MRKLQSREISSAAGHLAKTLRKLPASQVALGTQPSSRDWSKKDGSWPGTNDQSHHVVNDLPGRLTPKSPVPTAEGPGHAGRKPPCSCDRVSRARSVWCHSQSPILDRNHPNPRPPAPLTAVRQPLSEDPIHPPVTSPQGMILAGDRSILQSAIATNLCSCLNSHLHAGDQGVVGCQFHLCLTQRKGRNGGQATSTHLKQGFTVSHDCRKNMSPV